MRSRFGWDALKKNLHATLSPIRPWFGARKYLFWVGGGPGPGTVCGFDGIGDLVLVLGDVSAGKMVGAIAPFGGPLNRWRSGEANDGVANSDAALPL